MSETSSNLSLPFIQPAQAQKHVTHNEAIERLDLIVQLVVQSFDTITPPATPAEGQVWALGTGATGAWDGQDGKLAAYAGGGWLFMTPIEGWRGWGRDEGVYCVYSEGEWIDLDPDFEDLPGLGINARSDTTNRFSLAGDASLFNHDGGGHQIKINKSTQSDTASLLYQTGFSGRAEMGLAGTDDFAIKVSADGASWSTALNIAADSGKVTLAQAINLAPGTAPATPATGDLYFDAGTSKLRCYDGATWQDLY